MAAASLRGRCAAAAGSALLAGYSYLVHSRGLVMLAGFAAVAVFIAWRRPDPPSERLSPMPLSSRLSVVVAGLTALPPDQPQAWASGRYLDGMIIVFFLAGAAVLLRARFRHILACAAGATALFVLAAVTVAVYAGSSVPTSGFGAAFNFAEPAVLTLNWTQASVLLATAVTLGLLAVWIGFAAVVRHWWQHRVLVLASSVAFAVCAGAVGLVAVEHLASQLYYEGFSPPSRSKSFVIMCVSRGRRAGRG